MALAWCFADEQTPAITVLLQRVVAEGAFAPANWPLECVNALLMAERRRRVTGAERAALGAFLADLRITLDAATAARAWDTTAALAARFRLTAYDAAYLELAERRSLPLATLDGELRAAAGVLARPLLGT